MMQPYQSSDHLSGGRRMSGDRREFSYACCIPERRSGKDRRCGKDRRRQSRITAMMVARDETDTPLSHPLANTMD